MIGYLCGIAHSGQRMSSQGKQREQVYVSFKCFSSEFCSQVECIRRIVMKRERYFGCATNRIWQERYMSQFQVSFCMGRTASVASKTTVPVVSPLDYIQKQQIASTENLDCGICAAAIGKSIQGDSKIENGKFDIVFGSAISISYIVVI